MANVMNSLMAKALCNQIERGLCFGATDLSQYWVILIVVEFSIPHRKALRTTCEQQ
jgi:hypothetical protein